MTMKLKNHPAIQEFWSKLTYQPVGGSLHKIDPLESVLRKVTLITDDAGHERYFQLTRLQDGATAVLLCRDLTLLHSLERTLQVGVNQTIRKIGERACATI
jgi:hypothetical protein